MTLSLGRIIGFVVLTHTAFGAARVTLSLYALSNKASTFTVGVADGAIRAGAGAAGGAGGPLA